MGAQSGRRERTKKVVVKAAVRAAMAEKSGKANQAQKPANQPRVRAMRERGFKGMLRRVGRGLRW